MSTPATRLAPHLDAILARLPGAVPAEYLPDVEACLRAHVAAAARRKAGAGKSRGLRQQILDREQVAIRAEVGVLPLDQLTHAARIVRHRVDVRLHAHGLTKVPTLRTVKRVLRAIRDSRKS